MSIISVNQVSTQIANVAGGITVGAGANITGSITVSGVANVAGDMTVAGTLYGDVSVARLSAENAQTGTTYTLVLGDAGKMVTLNNASAITLSIPTNANVAFPIYTRIDLLQFGAGQINVSPTGITLLSTGAKRKTTGQYSSATLWKQASDTWIIIGDIV